MATSDAPPSVQFQEIPTLHLSEARNPETKPAFLTALRNALLTVGFLYLADTGLPEELTDAVIEQTHAFFEDLPESEKLKVEMKNEKSFLGYSRLGMEVTAGKEDWREQMDLSTPHPTPSPEAPLFFNLLGPNQWPSADYIPKFRPVFEEYMQRMREISTYFTSLIAEAIYRDPTAFNRFFTKDIGKLQGKLKLIKYPDSGSGAGQGVGPHKDSMLSSYLLQASHHKGLQAQNIAGEWIDCPPRRGTLIVAIGQGMEAITGSVCCSTTHRVLSPAAGSGARYSVPYFQSVRFGASFEPIEVPEDIKALKPKARNDAVEFTFSGGGTMGHATLMNRIKSHPDVGERWYPDLLAQIREGQAKEAKAKLEAQPRNEHAPPSEVGASSRTAVEAH